MHHAVGILAAVELGAAPLHAGIRRALQEMDAVDARQPLDVLERKDQRLVDEPMQHEPVVVRIDLGDAAMVALEAQAIRRDDAVEFVQRRERHRRFRRRGQPRHRAADHFLFVFRRHAVGRCADAAPSWRVQSGTFGGRFLALSASAGRARWLPRPSPAAPARNRRREAFVLSVGSVIGISRRMAWRSYHILICECNRKARYAPEIFTLLLGVTRTVFCAAT